jgi:sterol desaturase/sphingolipid hydroxylase (fatty acid hydroxylase superfamily)
MDTPSLSSEISLLAAYKGAVVAGWIALLLIAERVAPAVTRPRDPESGPLGTWARIGRNITLFAINGVLSRVAVIPLTVAAATVPWDWRPDSLGTGSAVWIMLLVDLVILDMWIYWWHRANHRLPFLWRFHEVHHLDEFLDVSSAVRFHAGEVLLSAGVRAVVIIALDIPLATVLVFETLVLVSSVFHHSNVKLPKRLERGLARLIVTPSIHWVHHHAVRRDTDSNYATVLSVWDRVFGSSSPTSRTPDMPIGTEGRNEKTLLGLLKRPLHD